jgi:hypothetical protein
MRSIFECRNVELVQNVIRFALPNCLLALLFAMAAIFNRNLNQGRLL